MLNSAMTVLTRIQWTASFRRVVTASQNGRRQQVTDYPPLHRSVERTTRQDLCFSACRRGLAGLPQLQARRGTYEEMIYMLAKRGETSVSAK